MRILSRVDVAKSITMREAMDACLVAYVAMTTGQARVPLRQHIESNHSPGAVTLFMPGYVPSVGGLGLKVVSVFPSNQEKGLPSVPGVVLLLSPETGLPVALLDGTYLTTLRTGAGVGVATELLAREDSRVLTVIGTGGLAFHQVEAVLTARPGVEEVQLVYRTRSKAEALAEKIRMRWDRSVAITDDATAAVSRADIVVTVTNSTVPVVMGAWLRPGTHVNAVGAHSVHEIECDSAVLERAAVKAVDDVGSVMVCGEVIAPVEAGLISRNDLVEIGAIATGAKRGRTSSDQITYFKSVGVAAQDITVGRAAFERAELLRLGTLVDL